MPYPKSLESGALCQPADSFQDGSSSGSFGGFSRSASIEKDAVETELERMVFGDDAGFQQELKKRVGITKDFSLGQLKIDASDKEIEDQDLFRGVDDADLFFIDPGPSAVHLVNRDAVVADKSREHSPDAYRAAWIDSDDERVQVSLSSNPRLRKLRVFEGEDYVNGKDYVKRLRQQYERLHPRPEWASQSILKKQLVKKRKRQIDGTDGSDEGSVSGSDVSSDNDELSARPLASILQNAGSLSQSVADARHRKKLRPEVIDIQRSRDVGPTQPWVAEVRVEGKGGVADFEWWGDGEGMTVLGKGGEAVEWDGRSKKIVARWIDDGAVGTTVVSSGGKGGPTDLGANRWMAVGSSSGIVNVYDRRTWGRDTIPLNPKPSRAFDQLTTPISHLVFSSHGQILVMASRWKRDALRLSK
ncbi:MAG: hypothetical protein LQ351_000767 [Letrouitia transgressa]|nr:MAG: hypothetical protein LQ351_000767 [Letrouitia transgressa]